VNRRALVVDDDAHIAEVLESLLEFRGFEVDVVSDGIHAIEPEAPYDVILLDMKMPVFDGERLVDYWTLTQPELLKRVIVLSAYSAFTRGRKLPVFATVIKPFEMGGLERVIEDCAGQSP
jgi:CheY-like chemotaxis protein